MSSSQDCAKRSKLLMERLRAASLRTSYNTYGDTILARVPEASMLSCILTDFSAARYN